MIPVIPLICFLKLGEAYDVILRDLSKIWGLKTKPMDLLDQPDNLHFGFLEATFNHSSAELVLGGVAIATYNLGPLTATQTGRIILKMIVGLTLIFEQLFLYQQKQGDDAPPLTKEVIRELARSFQMSPGRKQMSAEVDESMVWDTKYDEKEAKATAERAMKAGKSRIAQKHSKNEYALWNALKEDC
jgi:hypothetical protein